MYVCAIMYWRLLFVWLFFLAHSMLAVANCAQTVGDNITLLNVPKLYRGGLKALSGKTITQRHTLIVLKLTSVPSSDLVENDQELDSREWRGQGCKPQPAVL